MNRWIVFQALSFNVLWLLCVLGQNQLLIAALLLFIVQLLVSPNTCKGFKVLPLALLGIAVDFTLYQMGVLGFKETPYWLGALWIAFTLNFGHSFRFLRQLRRPYISIIGAVAGCYSYLISWRLEALELPYGAEFSAIIIAAIWAAMLPILVKLDQQIRLSA